MIEEVELAAPGWSLPLGLRRVLSLLWRKAGVCRRAHGRNKCGLNRCAGDAQPEKPPCARSA